MPYRGPSLRKTQILRHACQVSFFILLILWIGTFCALLLGGVLSCPLGAIQLSISSLAPLMIFPAIPLIMATVLFGRFFCAWICPLGTLIEAGKFPSRNLKMSKSWKYGIMLASVGGTGMLRFPAFCPVCPIGILSRASCGGICLNVETIAVPAVIGMNFWQRRMWCRYLCPVGAMLGIIAKVKIFGIKVEGCRSCGKCEEICPMGAISHGKVDHVECIMCLRCTECDCVSVGLVKL